CPGSSTNTEPEGPEPTAAAGWAAPERAPSDAMDGFSPDQGDGHRVGGGDDVGQPAPVEDTEVGVDAAGQDAPTPEVERLGQEQPQGGVGIDPLAIPDGGTGEAAPLHRRRHRLPG